VKSEHAMTTKRICTTLRRSFEEAVVAL